MGQELNQQKRVIRTERIWLKPHPNLLNVCHLSKNLFNEANYIVRQAFFSEGVWIKATELYQLLKESINFKTLPLPSALKILQLVEQMWKSFFNSTVDWKDHPEKYLKNTVSSEMKEYVARYACNLKPAKAQR